MNGIRTHQVGRALENTQDFQVGSLKDDVPGNRWNLTKMKLSLTNAQSLHGKR